MNSFLSTDVTLSDASLCRFSGVTCSCMCRNANRFVLAYYR